MKLSFKKDENSQISVFQKVGSQETEFSYLNMIKALIDSQEMEPPEISNGFTDAEVKSINNMIGFINKEIAPKD